MIRRNYWIGLWIVVVLSGPFTVFVNTSPLVIKPIPLMFFFQRIFGTLAYSLFLAQLLLGAYLNYFTQVFGAKAYRFHIVHGVLAYIFMIAHPVMQSVLTYVESGAIVPFLLFQGTTPREIFIGYGRIAFVVITVVILTGLLRTKFFLRRKWRKLHVLNYLFFYFVFIHSYKLGSDISHMPLNLVFWGGGGIVTIIVLSKVVVFLRFYIKDKLHVTT